MHVTAVDVAAYSEVLSDCYVATDADHVDVEELGGEPWRTSTRLPGQARLLHRDVLRALPLPPAAQRRAASTRSATRSTTDFARLPAAPAAAHEPAARRRPRRLHHRRCRWRTSSSGHPARTTTSSCEPPDAASPGAGRTVRRRRDAGRRRPAARGPRRTSTRRTTSTATSRTTTSGRPSSAGTPPSTTASRASASTPATPATKSVFNRKAADARGAARPAAARARRGRRRCRTTTRPGSSREQLERVAARGRPRGRADAGVRQQAVRRCADRDPQPDRRTGRARSRTCATPSSSSWPAPGTGSRPPVAQRTTGARSADRVVGAGVAGPRRRRPLLPPWLRRTRP